MSYKGITLRTNLVLITIILLSGIFSFYLGSLPLRKSIELEAIITVSTLLISIGALIYVETVKFLTEKKDRVIKEISDIETKYPKYTDYVKLIDDKRFQKDLKEAHNWSDVKKNVNTIIYSFESQIGFGFWSLFISGIICIVACLALLPNLPVEDVWYKRSELSILFFSLGLQFIFVTYFLYFSSSILTVHIREPEDLTL